jgi:hypothetical protein
MRVGIVGSEAAKFTQDSMARTRSIIKRILTDEKATCVVSGHCHLGGIDIWAEEVADEMGLEKLIFPPRNLTWSGGFKPRNLQIAHNSDVIYCITVDSLPGDYTGMRFRGCYHCEKGVHGLKTPHIKSGGCWTAIQAAKAGKIAKWVLITNP